jgi:NAD(P)H-flavin reductase
MTAAKQSLVCELININAVNNEIFRMDFIWNGPVPQAGQFFMVKPLRSSVFLARPLSLALWEAAAEDKNFIRKKVRGKTTPLQKYLTGKFLESNTVRFLAARRGKGTAELAAMRVGEEAELTGPLGNAWAGFLPGKTGGKPIAFIGGGIGIAPLEALAGELDETRPFDFYAGFRTGFRNVEEKYALLGPAVHGAQELLIAAENGKADLKGRIPDFLEAEKYSRVFACGPEPMLKAAAAKCKAAGTPCFISMERRMACGVGACLGCTVKTVNGSRRCCADGPIFNANEVIFDE